MVSRVSHLLILEEKNCTNLAELLTDLQREFDGIKKRSSCNGDSDARSLDETRMIAEALALNQCLLCVSHCSQGEMVKSVNPEPFSQPITPRFNERHQGRHYGGFRRPVE